MSLEDLSQYAPTQTAAINRLIGMGYFASGPVSLLWTKFKDSVWKKGLGAFEAREPVERDEYGLKESFYPPVEDDAIDDGYNVHTTALVAKIPDTAPDVWDSRSQRILVRSDYLEATQTALSASEDGRDVFLVTGQPGIGKTFFLLWLLIRRLALGLPTALQISPDCALLFHEDGVCQFTYLEPNEVYGPLTSPGPGRIWALVASSRALTQPAGVFGNGAPFFVIESASPRRSHLQWLQGADSQYFYMKRWSFPEVLQARLFLGSSPPYGERQLEHLYGVYGASTRALALYAGDPTIYERMLEEQLCQSLKGPAEDVQDFALMVSSPYSSTSTDLFVIFEPSPTSRTQYEKNFASKYVFEMAWNQHSFGSTSGLKGILARARASIPYPFNSLHCNTDSLLPNITLE